VAQFIAYAVVFLVTFGVAVFAAGAAWSLIERRERLTAAGDPAAEGAGLLQSEVLSTLSGFSQLLRRFQFVARLRRLLAEAEVNWSAGRTVLAMMLLGGLSFNLFFHIERMPSFAAVAAGLLGFFSPVLYLRWRRSRRLRQAEAQLPDALDYLSRALLAGHSLPMSLELAAEEVQPPLSNELRKTVDEYNLGTSLQDALENLANRLPTVDFRFFVSAVTAQARTGGNLNEVLDTIAETVREREALKLRIRTLTASGRTSAVVLTLLPVFVGGLMLTLNSEYFFVLVDHPLGPALLTLAIGGEILAFFVIRKLADVKV